MNLNIKDNMKSLMRHKKIAPYSCLSVGGPLFGKRHAVFMQNV